MECKFCNSKKLLNEGGIIILSTPNISNFASRLRFFMKGTFLAFEKNDLSHRHIKPLTTFQLEYLFNCLDLKILNKKAVGTLPIIHFTNIFRFAILRNFILPLFHPFMDVEKIEDV